MEIDPFALASDLLAANILLTRRLREADRSSELTTAQRSVISRLINHGPHTLGELAAAEKVRPPTITRIIQYLEREGFVVRKSTSDKRVSKVDYTSKAWTTLERAKTRRTNSLGHQIGELTSSQRQKLQEIIPILNRLSETNLDR